MIRNDGNAMMKIAHWRLEWDGWAVKRFGRSYKGEKTKNMTGVFRVQMVFY